jgi:hypothetical protein
VFIWVVGFVMAAGVVRDVRAAGGATTTNADGVVTRVEPLPASTRRMIERLDKIRSSGNPTNDEFLTVGRVKILKHKLSVSKYPKIKAFRHLEMATETMLSGHPEVALTEIQAARDILTNSNLTLDNADASQLRMLEATALLLVGEQENYANERNAGACLFPISPSVARKSSKGWRNAATLLEEQLKDDPKDLSARWLLNIAYMKLGEYPDHVLKEWLIPPKTFQSDCDFPRFTNVAGSLGVDVGGLAGGVILDDFDNDGFIDIVTSSWGFDGGLRYFHNDGDGHFSDRTAAAGLTGLMGGLNIQQTDYDNDGNLDIWVLRGAWMRKDGRIPPSLLRNNGDGTFTDITEEAGLANAHPSGTSVWFDYDGDGWLDLFVGNETFDPRDQDPCELYHNNHDGTFTECAAACGLRVTNLVKGVTCLDYDNDGKPDLYISCLNGTNILFHNDGKDAVGQWRFSDRTVRAGLKAFVTTATWAFDYDNDGWDDLFVSQFMARNVGDVAADYLGLPTKFGLPSLYHNNHDGTFSNVTAAMHLNHVLLGQGCNFGDLDNDGWLDFYLGTGKMDLTMLVPNRMFRNNEGRVFQDVTTAGGFGNLQKGQGIGFADLDNDGNQDIYEVNGGLFVADTAFNVLYLNPGGTNHWLKLKLEGTKSNRAAIGARIKVTVQTPTGSRQIFRTVNSGGSFGSNPLRQEIGLGNATKIEAVDVTWPASGIRQSLSGLEMDHFYNVREGDAKATSVELKRVHFDLSKTPQPIKMAMPNLP